ncbi:MAG: Hsp20/alpha crystallin family protein [Promethearchaeota archaeon]|nr:MAG: Hsp20/alpha crystallin family protein [Candidatus Lokiarchaeota archaeon]
MTESISKDDKGKEEVKEEELRKRIFSPEMCSYTNEDATGYIVEVVLPGVEKDTIDLKVTDDSVFVTGESEAIKYVGSYGLCCPIDISGTKAKYNNGLLKIEAPFKDITFETVDIDIE